MTRTVDAVYEGGVLRLKEPMPLPEGAHVSVTVALPDAPPAEIDAAAILDRISKLPLESEPPTWSGRDHDIVLYGRRRS